MDTLDGVTTIHGRFYELSSNYHKLMGNHALYYREALRYLGCIDLMDIPSQYSNHLFNLTHTYTKQVHHLAYVPD